MRFFLLTLAGLHLLRPDLDPAWRVISEYEIGPFGGLMLAAAYLVRLPVPPPASHVAA